MKRNTFLLGLMLAVSLSVSSVLHAATSDAQQATVIDSGSLSYDDLRQVTVFTDNVVLTKGSLILRADRLELREDPEGYQYAVATANNGKIVYVRQKTDGQNEFIEGTAGRIEYDGKTDQIHLVTQAAVKKIVCGVPQDEVKAQRITYNQRTETYTAVGGSQAPTNNGLVRTVIQPKGESSAPAKAC